MQRRAAKLVLEVDVGVSIEEQLGDIVVVLGAGVEQCRAALVGDGVHGRAVVEEIPTDGHVSRRSRDDQRGPPDHELRFVLKCKIKCYFQSTCTILTLHRPVDPRVIRDP